MTLPVFEITCLGFDGGTDETDDRILWVIAYDRKEIENLLKENNLEVSSIEGIGPLDDPGDCDFDITFTVQKAQLVSRVRSFTP